MKINRTPELLQAFTDDAARAIEVLGTISNKNYPDSNDLQMYTISVHGIKSALANIEETELSKTALELEQAGREKNIALIHEDTPLFLNALQALVARINPAEQENVNELQDEDPGFLHEELLVIQEACKKYDKNTIKNTVIQLRQKTWSRSTKNLINSIASHLLHSKFEDIAGEIKKAL